MYQNYIFDLYGTLVDIRTNERKPSLWKYMAQYMTLHGLFIDRIIFASPDHDRNNVDRRRNRDRLSALVNLSGVGILPVRSLGQIDFSLRHSRLHDRRDEQIRSEHIGILHAPALLILREIIEERPHHRRTRLARRLHALSDIGA